MYCVHIIIRTFEVECLQNWNEVTNSATWKKKTTSLFWTAGCSFSISSRTDRIKTDTNLSINEITLTFIIIGNLHTHTYHFKSQMIHHFLKKHTVVSHRKKLIDKSTKQLQDLIRCWRQLWMIPCNCFGSTPSNILWFKMHIMRRIRISLNYGFRTILPKIINWCHSSSQQ